MLPKIVKSNCGEVQLHLQAMLRILRPQDTLKMAVRLQSQLGNHTRYLAIVSSVGSQENVESVILGIDYISFEQTTLGLALPIWSDTRIALDGDGGINLSSCDAHHIFKPMSLQAMWSAFQCLHREQIQASKYPYFKGGVSHAWVQYYQADISSSDGCKVEWHYTGTEDDADLKVDCLQQYVDKTPGLVSSERQIKSALKDIMQSVDLDEVTSKDIRQRLSMVLGNDLSRHKEMIDHEMLVILGQMEKPSQIFSHLFLGTEWNASNWEELLQNNVNYILNVTKEVDNFFPGLFNYLRIRVSDDESTELLKYWDLTFRFISQAKSTSSAVLVHCKKGISRSSSTVIAYAMKAYDWPLEKALAYVKEKRNCITPNRGFMRQLEVYEGILDANRHRSSGLWSFLSASSDAAWDNAKKEEVPEATVESASQSDRSTEDSAEEQTAEYSEKSVDVSAYKPPSVITASENIIVKSASISSCFLSSDVSLQSIPCNSDGSKTKSVGAGVDSLLSRDDLDYAIGVVKMRHATSDMPTAEVASATTSSAGFSPTAVNSPSVIYHSMLPASDAKFVLYNATLECETVSSEPASAVSRAAVESAQGLPTSVDARVKTFQDRFCLCPSAKDEFSLKHVQQMLMNVTSGNSPNTSGYDTSSLSSGEATSSDESSEADCRRRNSKCSGSDSAFSEAADQQPQQQSSAEEDGSRQSLSKARTSKAKLRSDACVPMTIRVTDDGQITPGQVKRLQEQLLLTNLSSANVDRCNKQRSAEVVPHVVERFSKKHKLFPGTLTTVLNSERGDTEQLQSKANAKCNRSLGTEHTAAACKASGIDLAKRNKLFDILRCNPKPCKVGHVANAESEKPSPKHATPRWYQLVGENLRIAGNRPKVSQNRRGSDSSVVSAKAVSGVLESVEATPVAKDSLQCSSLSTSQGDLRQGGAMKTPRDGTRINKRSTQSQSTDNALLHMESEKTLDLKIGDGDEDICLVKSIVDVFEEKSALRKASTTPLFDQAYLDNDNQTNILRRVDAVAHCDCISATSVPADNRSISHKPSLLVESPNSTPSGRSCISPRQKPSMKSLHSAVDGERRSYSLPKNTSV